MAQTPEQIAGKLKQNKRNINKHWGRSNEAEQLKIKQRRAALVDKMKQKPEDAPPAE